MSSNRDQNYNPFAGIDDISDEEYFLNLDDVHSVQNALSDTELAPKSFGLDEKIEPEHEEYEEHKVSLVDSVVAEKESVTAVSGFFKQLFSKVIGKQQPITEQTIADEPSVPSLSEQPIIEEKLDVDLNENDDFLVLHEEESETTSDVLELDASEPAVSEFDATESSVEETFSYFDATEFSNPVDEEEPTSESEAGSSETLLEVQTDTVEARESFEFEETEQAKQINSFYTTNLNWEDEEEEEEGYSLFQKLLTLAFAILVTFGIVWVGFGLYEKQINSLPDVSLIGIDDETFQEYYEEFDRFTLQKMFYRDFFEKRYPISEKSIDEKIDGLKEELGDRFEEEMEERGYTDEQKLRRDIKYMLIRERAAAAYVSVTQDEIMTYYAELPAATRKPLEDIRDEINQSIRLSKVTEAEVRQALKDAFAETDTHISEESLDKVFKF